MAVTERIERRSASTRARYLDHIRAARDDGSRRRHLPCANLAHGFAACDASDKADLAADRAPNVAIVTAYNDMLSAHQPFEDYPRRIKAAVRAAGGIAQVAGGVPAMCDGITQGMAGMELSLLSRDVIALSTAVALSHAMFDAALYLGVCDKIVPGLLIGALSFGHLPGLFVPAGPMPSGLANPDKSKVRQLYLEGRVGRAELLDAEARAYHAPGTCTFYGTANSNQMLLEIMGLMLPGAAFINPATPLRDRMTEAAARRALDLTHHRNAYLPVGEVVDERAVVNAIVGLHATGGSTNHTIHLVAIARAAGIELDWDDFAVLSKRVPLLARVYPNGSADVNDFDAAGGMPFLIAELLEAGLLHPDVRTVAGPGGLAAYTRRPALTDDGIAWHDVARRSGDDGVLRAAAAPFEPEGGLVVLEGNLGRAVIKTSALLADRHRIEAPAICFASQQEIEAAFRQGRLAGDFVAVLPYQGPKASGMPELHKLSPILAVLQERGQRVALLTDGRMSGASGRIPAAIHLVPEAIDGGQLARLRDGDVIVIDARTGELAVRLDDHVLAGRPPSPPPAHSEHASGTGRELFSTLRAAMSDASAGASFLGRLPPAA
ncbi:MAG TPA: phosphogluconate dehydratase [Aestuariivirgaceae bacterium]|nr:phosphogluconate dehydratase [Aestuariivirgaceae bacterium]